MTFTNSGISPEGIPKAESIDMHPVEHEFMRVKFIQWLLFWAIIIVIAASLIFFVDDLRETLYIAAGSVILVILASFHLYVLKKSVAFKAYAIREHDVVYRTGWINRSVKVVPFNRIQHCSVDEGALARRFGLSSIRMFTSGGNDADIRIPGLKASFASDLRELIISKTREHGGNI